MDRPLSAEDAVLVRTAKAKLDAIACLPAATSELADSPQRAPAANKANHTPPAAQASSERQHGAVRQCVLLPASVAEELDERERRDIPLTRWPEYGKPWASLHQVGRAALEPNQP